MEPAASNNHYGWSTTSLGEYLISTEAEALATILPRLYGPTAVLLGGGEFGDYLKASQAATRILALNHASGAGELQRVVVTRCEALPFDAKSVALLILPHVLEFSDDPHQVLREVKRVLVPEGHVVILGFNPISLWGLRRLLSLRQATSPWTGQFYTLSRVRDWLAVLGFDANAGRMGCYLPPIGAPRLRARFAFMEKAGDRWWPLLGAVYLLVGKKREPGMTRIVPRWKTQRLAPGLVKPVAQSMR